MSSKQFLAFILLFYAVSASTAELSFSSGVKQNTLIELYTSEGCDSCPLADAWLSNFKHKDNLFSRNIPLAFHVDYFNNHGWIDKFSQSAFGKRQRQQVKEGRFPAVYTPGILINSVEYRLGWEDENQQPAFAKKRTRTNSNNFLSAYTKGIWFNSQSNSAPYHNWLASLNKPQKTVGKLSAHLADGFLSIDFANQTWFKKFQLNVALLGMGLESRVDAGENKGKVLKHDFVVLSHQSYEKKQKTKQNQQWKVALPNTKVKADKYALVIWLSPKDSLSIVQASAAFIKI